MKKILLILFISYIFMGCERGNEYGSDVEVDPALLRFEPKPGGAVMYYTIPKGADIHAISILYTSVNGEQMRVMGSYGSTNLEIKGFLDREEAVEAKVSYVFKDNRESKLVDVTFSTQPAGAIAIFDNLKVGSYWNGFMVTFEVPKNVDGYINVGYIGINPFTGEKDILLKETKLIQGGNNRLLYGDVSNQKDIEVVIWTEDFMQNEAKRVTYSVKPTIVKKMDSNDLTYIGGSQENEAYKIGAKYLFDGDTKGSNKILKNDGDYVFTTNTHILTEPVGILDLKEPRSIASLRIYSPLHINISYSKYFPACPPNYFIVYAGNDADAPEKEWVKISEYQQSLNEAEQLWWCYPLFNPAIQYKSFEELEAANPCFCKVDFDTTGEKYRYIRIKYLSYFNFNNKGWVMASEMEVYVGD